MNSNKDCDCINAVCEIHPKYTRCRSCGQVYLHSEDIEEADGSVFWPIVLLVVAVVLILIAGAI